MKKRKLSMLLTVITLFGLVSCSKPHVHEFDYDNLVWTWTKQSEGYSAIALATCKGCEEYVTQNASVTSSIVSPSTCQEQGVISYTAKATFEGKDYTDTKSDFLPLGDHKYGAATYTWDKDHTECVAHRECTVCHDPQEEKGVVESQIIKEATCEHSGLSNFKATFKSSWAETQYTPETVIPQKSHEYGTDYKCVYCKKTLKELNGLSDASEDDIKVPQTLSYYGQNPFDLINDPHTFVSCDFSKKGDFELIYNYKYTQKTTGGDSYYAIYIFNGHDEKGLVLHINTDRNNAGSDVYVFRNSATQAGAAYKGDQKVKDLPTTRSEEGHYYFPFKSGLAANTQQDTNVMQIKGTLIDKTTNEYNIVIKTGGSYAKLSQLTTDYNNGAAENDLTLKVTLGANYFKSLSNPCFRFSLKQAEAVHASDYAESYDGRVIVYKDLDGKVYAKKTFTSEDKIIAPEIKKDGYKFIGWHDQQGNHVNEIVSNGKYIVTPRFVESVKENEIRQTLSDFEFTGKDTTKWVSDWGNKENISTNGIKGATAETKAVETMFKFRYQSNVNDVYPVFGFTYDGIDENSRVNTRIDLISTRKSFRGYIYGNRTSLGDAGSSNRFEEASFQLLDNNVYMLSIQIVKNQTDFSINVTIQSLGSGDSIKVSKNFTYNSSSIIDFSNSKYTKMAVNSNQYSPMIKDAF